MEQDELLRHTVSALDNLDIAYALVGSLASSTWGEVRFTQDIDIVVQLGSDAVEELCDAFSGDQFYVSIAAAHEAVERLSQFNVLYPSTDNKIDFMVIGTAPWNQSQIERRQLRNIAGLCECYVAAPEDIILGKLIYYREGGSDKHLRDIRGIFRASGEIIDRAYLEEWVTTLGVTEAWGEAQAWIRDS
ncbi:MAG: nucleotidyl transferase AbiEii/AbiGii toxin family protein [Aeoliella sp.]